MSGWVRVVYALVSDPSKKREREHTRSRLRTARIMHKPKVRIIPTMTREAKAAAKAGDDVIVGGDVSLGGLVALDVDAPRRLGHLEPRLLLEPAYPVRRQAVLGQEDHEDLAL